MCKMFEIITMGWFVTPDSLAINEMNSEFLQSPAKILLLRCGIWVRLSWFCHSLNKGMEDASIAHILFSDINLVIMIYLFIFLRTNFTRAFTAPCKVYVLHTTWLHRKFERGPNRCAWAFPESCGYLDYKYL